MDYSQLSDFEINCEVLAVFEPDINHMCLSGDNSCFYDCGPTGDGWHQIDIPDYCNSAEDAWPIIAKFKIDISWGDNTPAPDEWGFADARCLNSKLDEFEYYEKSGNALRAAMIAFLKMQDANHA